MAKKEMSVLREPKDIVIVSFSGGETSAKMLIDICEENSKREIPRRLIVPFFNTGEENEGTLVFVKQVGEYTLEKYGVGVEWIQYEGYDHQTRKHSYKEVDFQSAYRSHDPVEILLKWPEHPFRKMIEYFGIPNKKFGHCTRELKAYTCRRWLRGKYKLSESQYTIATGIRADEIDRVTLDRWHPLALKGDTKPIVNTFWKNMPFRLELAGWEGNCKVCFKKSKRKLSTLMRRYPERFAAIEYFQEEYKFYVPIRYNKDGSLAKKQKGKISDPIRFFRGNITVEDIRKQSLEDFPDADDDSTVYVEGLDLSNGCEESCEAF